MNINADSAGRYEQSRALRDALEAMESLDGRKACIARMRLIGRLPSDRIAEYLGLPRKLVDEEWRFMRAWLTRESECTPS